MVDKITKIGAAQSWQERWKDRFKFLMRLGSAAELVLILLVWIILLWQFQELGGYSRDEILTYLIGGSIISLFSGWLLTRLIEQDIASEHSQLLVYKPFRYMVHILTHGWHKVLFPFALAIALHASLILVFQNSLVIEFDTLNWNLILILIVLAFIIEFLIAYLLKLGVFWTFESEDLYKILMRLKRMLAGNFFPLSLLPAVFLQFSLLLPFAYSFFVPAQLYLGKISREQAINGIFIQLVWILLFYIIIKIVWIRQKQTKKQAD